MQTTIEEGREQEANILFSARRSFYMCVSVCVFYLVSVLFSSRERYAQTDGRERETRGVKRA